MNIADQVMDFFHIILSPETPTKDKLTSLNNIISYLKGFSELSEYAVNLITCISDELYSDSASYYILQKLCDECINYLCITNISTKINQRIILVGDNPLMHSLEHFLTINDIPFLPYDKISFSFIEQYDAYFLFFEQGKEYPQFLSSIPEEKIINIHTLVYVDFYNAPHTKYIFTKFHNDIKVKKSPEILVTGLSYGRDAIHCDLLCKETVTLANSGQDLYYDTLCYEYAQKKIPTLNTVICVIAPYSLRYDESLSKTQDASVLVNYSIFRDKHNNSRLNDIIQEYDTERNKAEHLFNNWIEVSDWLIENYVPNKNWNNPYTVFHSNIINKLDDDSVRKRYNKPYELTLQENKELLIHFCNMAKMNTHNLLFFIPPFSNYYKNLWNEDYYNELINFLVELDQKYTIDCIDMSHSELPDHYFRDSGHLNRIGAIYISEIINQWILKNN